MTKKRVCLLTGAAGRLGSAFCRLYRSEYAIVAVYRRRMPDVSTQDRGLFEPLDTRKEPSAEDEDPIFAIQADLLDDGQIRRVVELALARHGAIDLVVHAAADTAFLGSSVDHDLRIERIQQQWHLNVMVPIVLSATVGRMFWRRRPAENRARGRGVVHVSSVSGLSVFPGTGQSIYAASKAALQMAAAHMADDFQALGVRSNVLAPSRFPDVVPTECVAEAIVRIDRARYSGRTMVLDARGESWLGGRSGRFGSRTG